MAKEYDNQLIQLLAKKKEYLIKMLELTKLQTIAIEDKIDDKLNQYIDDKQQFIDRINVLDDEFAKRFDTLKKEMGVESLEQVVTSYPTHYQELKIITQEVKKLIEDIFMLEKENSVKLKQRFDDIKGKLKQVSGGKKMVSAYEGKNRGTANGAFFDNKK